MFGPPPSKGSDDALAALDEKGEITFGALQQGLAEWATTYYEEGAPAAAQV